MSQSCHEEPKKPVSSCCESDQHGSGKKSIDWILWGSLVLVAFGILFHLVSPTGTTFPEPLKVWSHGTFELFSRMWWGLALGVLFVGLLGHVPRETVLSLLGKGGTVTGLMRATAAGVLLDLCSHGILAVGVKLYERGASAGQMMAFLLASPWNSLSLTLILVGLIGVGWTLVFVVLSMLIGLLTGWVFDRLVSRGTLPENPNKVSPEELEQAPGLLQLLGRIRLSVSGIWSTLVDGLKGARMVIRWALFGVVLAAMIRALMPVESFQQWFGPDLLGMMLTIVAATIIEVCSEGSTPIAADLFNRAQAPGNAFAFLMTGVATDYTEIMTIKDSTSSWKLALFLPLITVPQVVLIGVLVNAFS